MTDNKKLTYLTPQVAICSCCVERGFQTSGSFEDVLVEPELDW